MKKKSEKSSPFAVPSRPPRPGRPKPPPLPAAIDIDLGDLRDTLPAAPLCILVVHCKNDAERDLLAGRLRAEGFVVEGPT